MGVVRQSEERYVKGKKAKLARSALRKLEYQISDAERESQKDQKGARERCEVGRKYR